MGRKSKRGKTPMYRHQDAVMSERFAGWDAAARSWIRERALRLFGERDGVAVDITAGDVVIELDRAEDVPVGYARYIEAPLYDRRYQMVRTELERMERDGLLEAGTTVNARGREDVRCYRRREQPEWRVEIDPPNPAATSALERYVREHGDSLKGIDSILISRQYGRTLVGQLAGGVVAYGEQRLVREASEEGYAAA